MEKEAERAVSVTMKMPGIDAFIHSIVPLLVLVELFLIFGYIFVDNYMFHGHVQSVDWVLAIIENNFSGGRIIFLSILILLALNYLAYYVIFRLFSKVVAYPWCFVAICSQIIVVGYCVMLIS